MDYDSSVLGILNLEDVFNKRTRRFFQNPIADFTFQMRTYFAGVQIKRVYARFSSDEALRFFMQQALAGFRGAASQFFAKIPGEVAFFGIVEVQGNFTVAE